MPNHFYIYIYLNPLKPGKFTYGDFISFPFEPFYVGKGNGNQLYRHLYESLIKTHNPFKVRVINKIRNSGLEPIIIKLNFNLNEEISLTLEKFYIKLIGRRDKGFGSLTNLTDGGEGVSGYVYSEKQKRRRSKQSKKAWSNERKKKQCGKNSSSKRPEVRKKMSDTLKKMWAEGQMNDGFKNKHHSKKAKKKISVFQTGRKRSIKTRKKMSIAKKGGNNYNARKVMVNGNIYGCIKEACLKEKISKYLLLKNITNKIKGFEFLI